MSRLFSVRQKRKLIILAISILLAAFAGYQARGAAPTEFITSNNPGLYEVEEASDGDTIIVNMNGRREVVRMIGVDTPETHHPDRPVECYGQEASEFTRKLLTGQNVRLQADPLNTNRDRYDRLLRYVYLPDGTLVNGKLIESGYGFSYTSFPFSKTVEFNLLEAQAKGKKAGLWASCQITADENGERTNPRN
jgi:micrococcal nuclease